MSAKSARIIMPSDFFDWFDSKLNEKNLNDSQLAKKANVAPSVISKARNGAQAIGWDACDRIARALDIPTEVFLKRAGLLPKEKAVTEEDEIWVSLLKGKSDKDKKRALKAAKALLAAMESEE